MKIKVLISILMACFVITGCSCTSNNNSKTSNNTSNSENISSDEKSNDNSTNSSDIYSKALVGTWECVKNSPDKNHQIIYIFNEDGTGSWENVTVINSPFTYTASEKKLHLKYDGAKKGFDWDYSLAGDTLIVDMNNDGVTSDDAVYKKK